MEGVSLIFVFVFYILIRLLLGHHRTPVMKDRRRYQAGIDLVAQGHYSEALQYFDKILLQNAHSAFAYTYKAECHWHLRNYHQTLHYADKALDIDYSLALCYQLKGLAYYHLEQIPAALTEFDKAVWQYLEKDAEAFYYRGVCHHSLEHYEKAEYDFNRAAKLGHEKANHCLLRMKNYTDFNLHP
jgi:tetratricopeptide (TPR) repeat protein